MVQRRDEDDLGRRFSRVEQVRLERRRREKIEPLFIVNRSHVVVSGLDPVKRILFEPDQNIQGWIEGELGKMAESHRAEWNFDFKRGAPAGIPGHKWDWEALNGPQQVLASPPPQQQQQQPLRAPKPRAPWAARRRRATVQTPNASKVSRSSVDDESTSSQTRITDYMTARKRPNAPGSAFSKFKTSAIDGQSSSDEEENKPSLISEQ